MGFEPAKPQLNNIRNVKTKAFTSRIEEIQEIFQDNMLLAQADHELYANKRCGPAL